MDVTNIQPVLLGGTIEMSGRPDFLSSLPEELVCHCIKFLDVKSLVRMRAVNQRYLRLASLNEAGWDRLCREDLWPNKIFVPRAAKSLESSMSAYRMSLQDAKARQHLTLDELTFDEEKMEGTIWSFRFKESAGPDWTSWDPWHQGNQARQMVFLRNGSVKTYQTEDTKVSNVSISEGPPPVELSEPTFGQLVAPPVEMRWRFIARPMDLPERPEGSYVRLTVSGRDVPTYVVRRSPSNNWGFIMESCWGVWTSFPMPLKRQSRGERLGLRRMSQGLAQWVRWSDDDDEDDDVVMSESRPLDGSPPPPVALAPPRPSSSQEDRDAILADESSFIITNEVMWRESLLYNFGAIVLPQEVDSDIDQMMTELLGNRGPAQTDGELED